MFYSILILILIGSFSCRSSRAPTCLPAAIIARCTPSISCASPPSVRPYVRRVRRFPWKSISGHFRRHLALANNQRKCPCARRSSTCGVWGGTLGEWLGPWGSLGTESPSEVQGRSPAKRSGRWSPPEAEAFLLIQRQILPIRGRTWHHWSYFILESLKQLFMLFNSYIP